MSIYTTEPSKGAKNRALNRAQCEAFDWMRDHGEVFPTLRDLCHEISTHIDKERENL